VSRWCYLRKLGRDLDLGVATVRQLCN